VHPKAGLQGPGDTAQIAALAEQTMQKHHIGAFAQHTVMEHRTHA